MKNTFKRIGNLLATIFFSSLMVFGIFDTMGNANTDINELDQHEGILSAKGVTDKSSTVSSKGSVKSKVFYMQIDGLDQTLAVYFQSQAYDYISSRLNVGDTVKVYYRSSNLTEQLNLDTYQIEKNGEIILGQEEFKQKEFKGGIICIVGLFAMLTIGYFQDKKLRKKHKKITTANTV